MKKCSWLLVTAAYWLSNVVFVVVVRAADAASKGFLGIKVFNNEGNEHGLGGSKRPRRKLELASTSARKLADISGKQRTTRKANTKTGSKRGGKKHHVTEIIIDDDSLTDDAAPVDDAYADDYSAYPYDDDDHSTSVRGKAMGMGMMSSGRWNKKYDTHYKVDDFYPRAEELGFVDDHFFDDKFFHGHECELVTFNETFGMSSADLFLAPDTTIEEPGNPMYPGTVFLFEREFLLQQDGSTSINGTVVSGTCTRTEGGEDVSGAGLCSFVFVDDEGYSVNVNGLLVGPLGGKLAITGGTGGMLGVVGEMDFMPIYEDSKTMGDVFLDPIRYDVMAHLGLVVCP